MFPYQCFVMFPSMGKLGDNFLSEEQTGNTMFPAAGKTWIRNVVFPNRNSLASTEMLYTKACV